MKSILRKALNSFGYDVLKLKNNNSTIESNLINIIKQKKIECIIDVGANSGQYGTFLRKIGYDGYILSFEPVRHVFEKLQATAQNDEKWRCFEYALGEKEEDKEINVYRSTVFSSFLAANDYSKNIWNSLNDVHTETVRVRRLEDLYPDLMKDIAVSGGCMLKMDTQGYDLNVFNGARGILSNIDVLQSEISTINVYESMPDGLDMLKLFKENGYYISGMYSINRDEGLAAIEFDCLLVKRGMSTLMMNE